MQRSTGQWRLRWWRRDSTFAQIKCHFDSHISTLASPFADLNGGGQSAPSPFLQTFLSWYKRTALTCEYASKSGSSDELAVACRGLVVISLSHTCHIDTAAVCHVGALLLRRWRAQKLLDALCLTIQQACWFHSRTLIHNQSILLSYFPILPLFMHEPGIFDAHVKIFMMAIGFLNRAMCKKRVTQIRYL